MMTPESLLLPQDFASQRWLVGVSGGGDSMALAHMLRQYGASVAWAHVNHQWNSAEDEAAAFVATEALKYDIPLHICKGQGRATHNAEALARDERRTFFLKLCQTEGYAGVMLAHTLEDVAETFLMRAGKGSGVRGLGGMRADAVVGGLRGLRPCLRLRRAELRHFLQHHGHSWLEDPDNLALRSQRAKIRALWPQLDAAGIDAAGIAAAAEALARADVLLETLVPAFASPFSLAAYRQLPDEVAVRFQARAIAALQGEGEVPRTAKRLALHQRLITEDEGAATLGKVRWQWRANLLHICKEV